MQSITLKETVSHRINEIGKILTSMPTVKAGDKMQAEKWGLACERRRLRIKLSKLYGFTHTFKDEIDLINSVGRACKICGDIRKPSIDHIVPLSKGGHDGISNLQVLCSSCNSKKGGK